MSENIMGEEIVDTRDAEIARLRIEVNRRIDPDDKEALLRATVNLTVPQLRGRIKALESRLAQARKVLEYLVAFSLVAPFPRNHVMEIDPQCIVAAKNALRALEEPK